jgi:serine phosphatase RsbU (regulator of sigma subunit)
LEGDDLGQYTSLDNNDYQLFELKGDRQPIAIYSKETDFTTRQIQLQEGDTIYLFSDGFVDQRGDSNSKKFFSKNFKRYLFDIQKLSMEDQKKNLEDTLENWSKGFEQVDDILVIGIRV